MIVTLCPKLPATRWLGMDALQDDDVRFGSYFAQFNAIIMIIARGWGGYADSRCVFQGIRLSSLFVSLSQRFAALEEDGYRVLNSYNIPLSVSRVKCAIRCSLESIFSLIRAVIASQKLFYEWAGKNLLPPDALRTWKDAKRDLRVMDVSTFLRLLSHHGVIPVRFSFAVDTHPLQPKFTGPSSCPRSFADVVVK